MRKVICPMCGNQFETESTRGRYCSDECRRKAKVEASCKWNKANRSSEKKVYTPKRKQKKPSLSIEDVLRIGRENGIIGYSRILNAIDRGEIEI